MSQDPDTRKAQTRALFNSLAPDYDAAGPGNFAHFGERLVEFVGVEPGQRALDVATGRGAVLFPAAKRIGPAGEAVGIDLSDGMAQVANAEAVRRGLAARALVMDGERLGFPGASFDRVFCGFGIMFFPDLDRALAEFRRVLKPGGKLGVSTWRVSQTEDLLAVLSDLGLGRGTPPGWITEPDVLARTLERAGFTDVRVGADSEPFVYADLNQYWQNARGTRVRGILDVMDASQLDRARAVLAERLRAQQKPDGLHVVATALLAVANR